MRFFLLSAPVATPSGFFCPARSFVAGHSVRAADLGVESAEIAVPAQRIRSFPHPSKGNSALLKAVGVSRRYKQRMRLRTGIARSRDANCRSVTGAQLAGLLFSVHIGVSWSLAAPLFAGLRRTQRTTARGRACLASLGCGPCEPCPHLARRGSAGAMSYCGRDFSEDELDPEQRNGIPLSNALPCRASCANALTGVNPTAA